ncbi:hypothetical protein C0584_01140 [Candidatus Parcubacteria bacterium]|nr:MAG: hypothetical protein C0584_01140 [Candidatus Parcubacteria bacterium]
MKKQFKFYSLVLFLLLSLSACSFSVSKKPSSEETVKNTEKQTETPVKKEPLETESIEEILAKQLNINKFSNPEELKEFLENNSQPSVSNFAYRDIVAMPTSLSDDLWGAEMIMNEAADSTGLGAKTVSGQDAVQSDNEFSKTNIQVEGVDEADIVKTDGEYIYSLSGSDLYIVKANPSSEAEIMSKIKFDSSPRDIYIKDDKLVVFGYDNKILEEDFVKEFRRRSQYTYFKVFDISNKKEPRQLKNIDFEGSYSNSRLIGDYVYFVTNSYGSYIKNEPLLPRILEGGKDISCTQDRCIMPDVYYFDFPYYSYNFTSVNVIDLSNLESEIEREVYILANSQNMYVSQKNIYITYTKYINESTLEMAILKEILMPRLPEKDRMKIVDIEGVENYVLSEDEKTRKIGSILESYVYSFNNDERKKLEEELEKEINKKYEDISKELEKTVIHKISINGTNIEYLKSGEVTGHVLNQFSMDESGGNFRIATTKNRTWSQYGESKDSYSNLYVLDENLKQIGAVEDIAPGERIYSVRFMQDRAYLVTFKQTDPLFVIDLSSPSEPKILGELKIPGFSNYLHPYDEKTLIGIGKDTELNEYERVITKGLKVSLFDVSDVEEPRETDSFIIGDAGSDSLALNDHKAFLFSRENNLLVIPATLRESENNSYGKVSFRGALWFEITKDNIDLKSQISHYSGSENESDKTYRWNGYNYYDSSVKRSLYINDVLYTISDKYIKMNSLSSADELNSLKLDMEKDSDFEIIN